MAIKAKGYHLEYRKLDAKDNRGELAGELTAGLKKFLPERIVAAEPGEFRIEEMLKEVATEMRIMLEIRADRHFFCKREEFAAWAKDRKQLHMEHFYREMRKRHGVLLEKDEPVGGHWNFDVENRGNFGKAGPHSVKGPHAFAPDETTQGVLRLVEGRFARHPGSLAHFNFPVNAAEADQALRDFVEHRLSEFGEFQDAMWTGEAFLFHSRISAALNLKLLNPRRVIALVARVYREGKRRWPQQKDLFGRCWAGVNMCGAFTGCRCRSIWK